MQYKAKAEKEFAPCPEYNGVAVCVDVTPPRTDETQFGPKERFKLVFETPLEDPDNDNRRFCVWSRPIATVLSARSTMNKIFKGWLGQKENLEELDPEEFIGRCAKVLVEHEDGDNGTTYANLTYLKPWDGDPLEPSGKYIRVKDRKEKSDYRKVGQGPAPEKDETDVKIHVGGCKGMAFNDVDNEHLQKLYDNWIPEAKKQDKLKADDKRLLAALEKWHSEQATTTEEAPY